jgi:hypothetical protein
MKKNITPPAVQQWLRDRGISLSPSDFAALGAGSFATTASFLIHTDGGEPSLVELMDTGVGEITVLIGDRRGVLYAGPVTAPAAEVGGIVRAMGVNA